MAVSTPGATPINRPAVHHVCGRHCGCLASLAWLEPGGRCWSCGWLEAEGASHPARPLHAPEGGIRPRTLRLRATVHEATRRSPCHRLDPTERSTRSHAPGRHDPSAYRERGTGLISREASDVLSYRYATSQNRAMTDTPRPTLLLSRAINALTACGPFASHSTTDVVGRNDSGRRLTSVSAGQASVEPPAGIEPATPSLPFVLPRTCNKAPAGQWTVSVRS